MAAVPAGVSAFVIVAQAATAWPVSRVVEPLDCGSVVVVRCATPAPRGAVRLAVPPSTELDVVVIEATRLPAAPSLRELLQRAARGGGPARFVTRAGADGSTCTCYEPCVLNCCQCSAGGNEGPARFGP